jgi:hypothetical protein
MPPLVCWGWMTSRIARRISFGTILIDLEKRVPVDLLPDREAETVAKWLKAHQGVELMRRDRGGDYAKGATLGAPNAQQIADRWHILKHLSETMQNFAPSKAIPTQSCGADPASICLQRRGSPICPSLVSRAKQTPGGEEPPVPSGACGTLSQDPRVFPPNRETWPTWRARWDAPAKGSITISR